MTTFIKLWDKADSYSGDSYDLLDDKVKTFLSVCRTAGIREEHFHAIFPRILTYSTKTYFQTNIGSTATFAVMYAKLKTYFDTDVNREHHYTQWTTLTFSSLRSTMPDDSLQDVLNQLLMKLQRCQRALGREYVGEEVLRGAVIRACRGVTELSPALFEASHNCQ